jgi:steroid delta-isomerase
MSLERVVHFYETLTIDKVTHVADIYAEHAYFKDPFNEVNGVTAIQRIFTHMFGQVGSPRFIVTDQVVQAHGAFLVWEFHFTTRSWGKDQAQTIRGVSHLAFDASGKVVSHRDYWDAAEELYMKFPVLGTLMRGLRRMLRA